MGGACKGRRVGGACEGSGVGGVLCIPLFVCRTHQGSCPRISNV